MTNSLGSLIEKIEALALKWHGRLPAGNVIDIIRKHAAAPDVKMEITDMTGKVHKFNMGDASTRKDEEAGSVQPVALETSPAKGSSCAPAQIDKSEKLQRREIRVDRAEFEKKAKENGFVTIRSGDGYFNDALQWCWMFWCHAHKGANKPVMIDHVQLWKNHHATFDTKISHYEFESIVSRVLGAASYSAAKQDSVNLKKLILTGKQIEAAHKRWIDAGCPAGMSREVADVD